VAGIVNAATAIAFGVVVILTEAAVLVAAFFRFLVGNGLRPGVTGVLGSNGTENRLKESKHSCLREPVNRSRVDLERLSDSFCRFSLPQ